jgi:hypothetical protein
LSDQRSQRGKALAWLTAVLAAAGAFAAALIGQSYVWAGAGQTPAPLHALAWYWVTFGLLWLVLTVGLCRLGRWANRWRGGGALLLLILLALAVRLVVVAGAEPVLSDDIYRYLHEGALLAEGTNPYAKKPINISPEASPLPSALERVNHPELGAVYQPAAQYVFAGLTWLHQGLSSIFGEGAIDRTTTFRLGMVGFDLLILLMLIARLREAGRSPWWAGLWALHPLVISEVAGSGHQDIIGVTALLAGLLLFERANRRLGFAAAGGVALALAVAVKPVAAPVALPVAWQMRRWWGGLGVTALSGALVMAALYSPFILMPGGIETMVESVREFAGRWKFNGSIHPWMQAHVDPLGYDAWWRVNNALAWVDGWLPGQPLGFLLSGVVEQVGRNLSRYLLAGAALGGLCLSIWRSSEKLFRPVALYLLLMMLGTSTLHPWYVLWALVLMPLTFDAALWVLSGTIMVSYIAQHTRPDYTVPEVLKWVEFAPVYALAVLGWLTGWGVTRPGWLQPLRGAQPRDAPEPADTDTAGNATEAPILTADDQ